MNKNKCEEANKETKAHRPALLSKVCVEAKTLRITVPLQERKQNWLEPLMSSADIF